MKGKEFKQNDRVKRANGPGILGVVKEVKYETQATAGEGKDRGRMISVLWDNGTISYFAPEALEVVETT